MALPLSSLAEALAWLDVHIDYEAAMPDRRALPTLEPMRELMTLLGDPHRTFPAVHITGTNGKGSTAAVATALFGAAGLSVGTYTSPNLSRVNERLARGGLPIDDESFAEALGVLSAIEPMLHARPTRFELLTAAAFWWFADQAVDVAVVEVGLGGTWDCTNVLDAEVAVVTNVSLDHTDVLGPTREGIARDKAGIMKPGSRAVVGETDPDLVDVVQEVAEQAGVVELWLAGQEFDCTADRLAVGGRLVDLRTPGAVYQELYLPLHGPHQSRNAAGALAAVEAFFARPLAPDVVSEGFAQVRVDGRLEVLGRRPLILVDGAHNAAGMAALARSLREEFSVPEPGVAVVGIVGHRDPVAMLAELASTGVCTVVTCAADSPRAIPAEGVADAARAVGFEAVAAPSVADAVARARELVTEEGLLLVTGSLYVVTEARELLAPSANVLRS